MDNVSLSLPSNIFSQPLLQKQLNEGALPIPLYKQAIKDVREYLDSEFMAERDIRELIKLRAVFIDQLLTSIWHQYTWPEGRICLVAAGGYGRGEMAPQSDVDLLFVTPYKITAWADSVIESVLYILWDLKLKVGHATRTIRDCVRLGAEDFTIQTALLEHRFVTGDAALATTRAFATSTSS